MARRWSLSGLLLVIERRSRAQEVQSGVFRLWTRLSIRRRQWLIGRRSSKKRNCR